MCLLYTLLSHVSFTFEAQIKTNWLELNIIIFFEKVHIFKRLLMSDVLVTQLLN